MIRRNSHCVLGVAVGIIAALAGEAFSAEFSNHTPILIPGSGSANGSASVYPSVISVSGLADSINFVSSVSVEIVGFSDTDPSDVRLTLVGPTGARW